MQDKINNFFEKLSEFISKNKSKLSADIIGNNIYIFISDKIIPIPILIIYTIYYDNCKEKLYDAKKFIIENKDTEIFLWHIESNEFYRYDGAHFVPDKFSKILITDLSLFI